MKALPASVLVLVLASCTGGDGRWGRSPDSALARIQREHPCERLPFRSHAAPGLALSAAQRCSLVTAAYRAIAAPLSPSGNVPRSDTIAITDATLSRFDFPDLDTGDTTSYWSVDFQLPRRGYNAQVQIDTRTGKFSVARAHK